MRALDCLRRRASGDGRRQVEGIRFVVGRVIRVCLLVWRRRVGWHSFDAMRGCASVGVMPGIFCVCSGWTGERGVPWDGLASFRRSRGVQVFLLRT